MVVVVEGVVVVQEQILLWHIIPPPPSRHEILSAPRRRQEEKMSLNAKIGVVFLEGELPPPLTSVDGLAAGLENPQTTDWQLHPTRPTTARVLTDKQLTACCSPAAVQRPNTLQLYL